ncbi:WD40 repeat-like protein [Rhizophagus irregularis]|uniref:WD40 repeat-like protein n=3 Tax=Rhizophagus irregularis TaxID=588596 RepID=A0A2I1G6L4_9GLOM|nr:mitotic checkpoint protein BUB3 [Rhizophagus irregularis DAOM 181602=DAOM 197198]EXX52975.1 Gle2p [Rhizophagus irregularis DAOM 197198w]PKC09191.1 WD40 repeat-like protein [Rhizophagus irregularis]PKC70785.1 WD40 repeat-like protein [Rhizophagus irregularis]PKK78870.1 WD40 repeat-like protein [Rhizophagus irregularis]PKY42287.1 WD40 repeat-like protein [Rhizophagus irregularis]|eukprot:XP_025182453.1 mitotic checkpoint protein BUB3 [Rhizophagus irregularis DAOM 181602=DAOM 197198]
MQQQQFELVDPPSDAISSVVFSPTTSNHLLVSSWDKTVRLYDINENSLRASFQHKASVLDCCFSDGVHIFSGGLDHCIKSFDINSTNESIVGLHDKAVKCVEYSLEKHMIVSGSWDCTIRLWDIRKKDALFGQYEIGDGAKVFALSLVHYKLVVATAGRQFFIYDIRNMSETIQKRESSLKFMTRCVKCMPNRQGYASSSIEGRVAVEFFDPSPEAQARKYAFKCHRKVIDGVDTVYPVNALAFHPTHGTFASGGADGMVNIWDGFNKKRLRQYPQYPTSIASLDFSRDGQYLAIASSYTFEEGEKDHPPDSVFIKPINENECKPRVMASSA